MCRRWLSAQAERRRYERRNEVLEARQLLERQFSEDDDTGGPQEEGKGKA
jgi:hypothetical protein